MNSLPSCLSGCTGTVRRLSGFGDNVPSYPGEVNGSMHVAILLAVVDGDLGGASALFAYPPRRVGARRANTSAQFRAPERFNHEHPFRLPICITSNTFFLFRIDLTFGASRAAIILQSPERRGGSRIPANRGHE